MKKKTRTEPFTNKALIEYIKSFDDDAQLHITILQRHGNTIFGYPVKNFTLLTDGSYPHFCIEVDRGVKVTRKMLQEDEPNKTK